MNAVTPLLDLAKTVLSPILFETLAIVVLLVSIGPYLLRNFEKSRKELHKFGRGLRKTTVSVQREVENLNRRINALMGYQENRPPRPYLDATFHTGDVILYWSFFMYFMALGIFVLLLAVGSRSHNVIAIMEACGVALGCFVFAGIARNRGALSAKKLIHLFQAYADTRGKRVKMVTSCIGFATALFLSFAWLFPYMHR